MLDRLPTELLLHTLELAAPLDYSFTFYPERRLLLRNLSLVSKFIRTLAQPKLTEAYKVRTPKDVEVLRHKDEKGETRGSKVKVIVMTPEESYDDEGEWIDETVELDVLATLIPNIVDFRLETPEYFGISYDLSVLARLPGLF
jgi:hypothetical protein